MKRLKLAVGGVKIKSLAAICTLICALMVTVIHVEIWQVDSTVQALVADIDRSLEGQQCAIDLGRSSDYLTEKVRLYVALRDPAEMRLYFDEVESQNRQQKVERLRTLYGKSDPAIVERLEHAMQISSLLELTECHAMSLVSHALELPKAQQPRLVANWALSAQEQALGREEMLSLAYDMVYGNAYITAKREIKTNIDSTLDRITSQMHIAQSDRSQLLEALLARQRFFTIMMILLVGLIFWLLGYYIVHPIQEHLRSIRAGQKWKDTGTYELRCLAHVYNQLHDRNEAYQAELEYKAWHDALTGLYNRAAFDQKKNELSGRGIAVMLILADINKFKWVNDAKGHKVGDETIRRVATALSGLRLDHICCIARIGGDEFALLLRGVGEEVVPRLQQEIGRVNRMLAQAKGEIPAVSVSMGAAFTADGYSDKLFQQADQAMYQAKQQKLLEGCIYRQADGADEADDLLDR
ncbi:MAG: diguanylate cyclase [Eubacteriales bacterium]|nr:diguanylate cyclase [Eubacteriales bacterium]